MESELKRILSGIRPLDQDKMNEAACHLDRLTKPPGSLGRLEDLAVQLAGITRNPFPDFARKAVIVMASDHGVCEENVSAYPQEVTAQMVRNMLQGGAAVNVLARQAGADVFCVDIGVKEDLPAHPQLKSRKIRRGTANIARGPAMSEEEAMKAILVGVEQTEQLVSDGYRVVATGEMGIGNTTPSAALLTAMTGKETTETVWRGTGIDDERLRHKRDVVEKALAVNRPDPGNPIGVLAKVGGLDIAGLTGVILGAARCGIPVIIDGFISSAAALMAGKLSPVARDYMIPSHLSGERGHRYMLEAVALRPMLRMDMRLGEGTGAVLCFPLLDAAVRIMKEMATFEGAGVSRAEQDAAAKSSPEANAGPDAGEEAAIRDGQGRDFC